MEPVEVLNKVDERIGKLTDEIGGKLNEFSEKLSSEPEQTAELEQGGAVEGLTRMEVWDIPVGEALVGGFVAVFGSELIDGLLAKQSGMVKGITKLVGAGVAAKWGRGLLGSTGSKAVALLLAYDGIRSLVPVDEWAGKAAGMITPRVGAGLAGKAGMENPGNAVQQAEEVAQGYYTKALGGA